MRYIVICKDNTAFYTDWHDYENLWNPETMTCIIDLAKDKVTFSNDEWIDMEEDYL